MSTPPLGSPASPAAADAKAGRRKLAIVIVVFVVVMPCLVLTGTVGLLIYFGQRQQASRSEAEKLELTCRFADKWTTSCHKLGLHYLNGTGGVTRDAAKAAERFRKSCDLGYQGSCSSLGYLLARGEGVERDVDRAVALYEQGCEKAEKTACANLGRLLIDGQAVQKAALREVVWVKSI